MAIQALVPLYRGTVQLAVDDPAVSAPAPASFTQTDAGVHDFTLTLLTAGIIILRTKFVELLTSFSSSAKTVLRLGSRTAISFQARVAPGPAVYLGRP